MGECNCRFLGRLVVVGSNWAVGCRWWCRVIGERLAMVGSRWPEVEMPKGKYTESTDCNRKVKRGKIKVSTGK